MKTKKSHLVTLLLFSVLFSKTYSQIDNTFTGNGAGVNNTANGNSGFGVDALKDNSNYGNSAFGFETLRNNTGSSNIAIGYRAISNGNKGNYNIALGHRVMGNNTTGGNNIAIGLRTFEANTTGGSNIAIGPASLFRNTEGNNNIAMGYNSGFYVTSGVNNIIMGYNSGINLSTGSYNTFIGKVRVRSGAATATQTGFDTEGTIVLANGNGNQPLLINNNGYTGIGLGEFNIPQNRLELASGITGTSGLRFRNYTSTVNPPSSNYNGKFLTLNANGDVVLAYDQVGTGGATLIQDGVNTIVAGNGTVGNEYEINAQNIYTHDGTLTSNRTMLMNNNRLMFNTANNSSIYIGNTSNVLDNNNFPTSSGNYKLYVEGGILTEKVKVALRSTANWADYVFDKDYDLMSLVELENYIKENKHLPGIESADKLVKNGLDLGDMQAKQMAKIEELTLYIIKQNKTLEKQSKDIEELKAQVKTLLNKSN